VKVIPCDSFLKSRLRKDVAERLFSKVVLRLSESSCSSYYSKNGTYTAPYVKTLTDEIEPLNSESGGQNTQISRYRYIVKYIDSSIRKYNNNLI
jgi:hypothetical protein